MLLENYIMLIWINFAAEINTDLPATGNMTTSTSIRLTSQEEAPMDNTPVRKITSPPPGKALVTF